MKKLLLLLLPLLLCLPMFSAAADGLTLREGNLTFALDADLPALFPEPSGERVLVLIPGRETQLHALLGGNRASMRVSVSDPEIVSARGGTLKGLRRGVCEITLISGRSGVEPLTLTAAVVKPVESVRAVKPRDLFAVGQRYAIETEVLPEDADWKKVVFTVSDTEVLRPEEDGFTCLSSGYVLMWVAAADGSGARDKLHVKSVVYPESLEILHLPDVMSAGRTARLEAAFTPEKVYQDGLIWSVSDPAVASVSSSGVLKALSPGTCEVTAVSEMNLAVTAKGTVTVTRSVNRVSAPFDDVRLAAGETWDPRWSFAPEDASPDAVRFSSSDESVARVDGQGRITASAPGKCVITARDEISRAEKKIDVKVLSGVSLAEDYSRPGTAEAPEVSTAVFGKSEMGRDLLVTRIGREDAPLRVLLVFGMHGWEDEAARDGDYLLRTAKALIGRLSARKPDPDLAVWIVQCMNPDGLIGGVGTNAFGRCNALSYDINRDFPEKWMKRTAGRNRTGNEPFTTAEARALRDLTEAVDPFFTADIHGFIGCVYGTEAPGRIFAEELGLNYTSMWGGGMFSQWAETRCLTSLLVELPKFGSADPDEFAAGTAEKLEAALLRSLGE